MRWIPCVKQCMLVSPLVQGCKLFEILTIKNVPDKCTNVLMSRSRQVQILYRADAFLIGYGNTACSLLLLDGSLVDMMLGN